eukprot:TRINITY_DN121_c0_g5_i1.p1 TRINITY_DN121_c0_g5~~TRINITY_DN121_c0_g5_i1.p1  ORF type:complete len:229 (+),score=98.68 TRINITY_DN121_c0_g5_i1:230-916(+)
MPLFGFLSKPEGNNTFKKSKKKRIQKGTLRHTLKKNLKANLSLSLQGGVRVTEAVRLPPGENRNEWIAMNTIELYNTVSLVYSLVSLDCTDERCPCMNAGPNFEYLWADGDKFKKPVKVSAPEYYSHLTTWINAQLDNEAIFPTEGEFPPDFTDHVRKILQRLFRVYAHIYYSHWEKIKEVSAETHVNVCFKHFYFFVKEFALVEDAQMEPLQHVIDIVRSSEGVGVA